MALTSDESPKPLKNKHKTFVLLSERFLNSEASSYTGLQIQRKIDWFSVQSKLLAVYNFFKQDRRQFAHSIFIHFEPFSVSAGVIVEYLDLINTYESIFIQTNLLACFENCNKIG